MTTVELRTSIMEELDQMSVEMLESVSKYVKRLRHHTRSARKVKTDQNKREAAMLFVKNLSVQGGMPVPAEERGVEALVNCSPKIRIEKRKSVIAASVSRDHGDRSLICSPKIRIEKRKSVIAASVSLRLEC